MRRITPDEPGFPGREALVELVRVLRRTCRLDWHRVAALIADLSR